MSSCAERMPIAMSVSNCSITTRTCWPFDRREDDSGTRRGDRRADVGHPAARNRNRKADEVLGRPVCRPDGQPRMADITRAFSMANAPSETGLIFASSSRNTRTASFRRSSTAGWPPVRRRGRKGPYGTCFRREERPGPMLLIGGRLGHVAALVDPGGPYRERRAAAGALLLRCADPRGPVLPRRIVGDRGRSSRISNSCPCCPMPRPATNWDGEPASFTRSYRATCAMEAGGADRRLRLRAAADDRRRAAGPVQVNGVEPERIYFDKFTPAVR